MQNIQGNNRNQTYFITLDDQLVADNLVRLIDAFIDKLDLQKLGFSKTVPPALWGPSVIQTIFTSHSGRK